MRYTAYNLSIDSEIDLPELLPVETGNAESADVKIHFGPIAPEGLVDGQQLGPFLWVTPKSLWLQVPRVARFLVSNGNAICIDPEPGIDEDSIRVFLLGSVLGALLFQRGHLVLHGNAIRIGDQCMVCVGHSGAGKSTLAAGFMQRGHQVLADDVVPVDADCRALPGFPRIKLWQDVADKLKVDTSELRRIRPNTEKFNYPVIHPVADTPLPILERATYDSVAFRFIAANHHPDHDTLAHFRKTFLVELEDLFVQVLTLAKTMKLVKLGQIALDGTKLKANASKHKALSYGHIEKREAQLREEVRALLKKAAEVDQEELADGIDLPAEIARREDRLQALAEAKAKIVERVKERDAQAEQDYRDKLARREAQRKAGKKPRGPEPKAPEAGPKAKDQINLTDQASRIMPSHEGFVQGYNAQAAVDVDSMLVVAATLTQDTNDKQQVEPMLSELKVLQDSLGKPESLLADNGYFSKANIQACVNQKIAPLIALGREAHHLPLEQRLTPDAPEPESAEPLVKMAWKLKTQSGRALYGQRKSTVEPVFGIIKQVLGFRQFSLRGLDAVTGEWKLVTMAFNLKRMHVLTAG